MFVLLLVLAQLGYQASTQCNNTNLILYTIPVSFNQPVLQYYSFFPILVNDIFS